VKRDDLIRKINKAADSAGTTFQFVRRGGSHDVYRYGAELVIIPRHREINELTARGILRDLGIGK
jgi:mRNA interferase HicA